MRPRLSLLLLLALAPLAACQWGDRPDGSSGVHTGGDDLTQGAMEAQTSPEIVEPLDGEPLPDAAPVPLDQPAPTSGTEDATSEVEEALTPGSEQ